MNSPLVCVYGFISEKLGKVLFYIKETKAFNTEDFVRCFKYLYNDPRLKFDDVVLFADNATLHKTPQVWKGLTDNSLKILFNMPYRPDLMGIESTWQRCKHIYKNKIAKKLVHQKKVNNFKIVKKVIKELKNEDCIADAANGWKHLLAAKPKDYPGPFAEGDSTPEASSSDCDEEEQE